MNEWDAIEKMINTLPQWDVIKWIMGIQEELKCAKEDNLYQLRQNKNLQSKIDKANELIKNKLSTETYQHLKELYDNIDSTEEIWEDYEFEDLLDILKEEK